MIGGVGSPALCADVTSLLIGRVFFLASRAVASATIAPSSSSISGTYNWRRRRFLRTYYLRNNNTKMR